MVKNGPALLQLREAIEMNPKMGGATTNEPQKLVGAHVTSGVIL